MALRELFAPWFAGLQRVTDLDPHPSTEEIRDARMTGVLWVSYYPQRAHNVDDEFPSEAFELLALIARVDRAAWRAILAQLWPFPCDVWLRLFRERRFEVGVEILFTPGVNLSRVCGQCFVGDSGLLGSDQYRRVRQHLEEMVASTSRVREDRKVCVPVRIRLPLSEAPEIAIEPLWVQVLQVASLEATLARYPTATVACGHYMPSQFRLMEVKVNVEGLAWSKRAIQCASQLVARGFPVRPVDLRGVDMTSETTPYLTPMLHQFFGIEFLDGSDHVLVNASYHVQQLDAIFSALLVSTTVRELQVDIDKTSLLNEVHRERLWYWIALVGFSGHASNRIQKITLDVSALEERDVEAVSRLLESSDPLSLLYPTRSRDQVASASRFRLTAPSLLQSASIARPTTIKFSSPVHDLVVLNGDTSNQEWIGVILPGWGQAWVAANEVTVSGTRPRNMSKVRPNRQLVLVGSQDKQGIAVGDLLRLIAPQVEVLRMQLCRFSGMTVRHILNVCPRLDEMQLDAAYLSYLHRIASAYEDGRFRAQRVYLNVGQLLDEDDAYEFFDRLADPGHPMTQHLRVLHITLRTRDVLRRIQTSVVRMLKQNKWLHEFQLALKPRYESGIDLEEDEEGESLRTADPRFDGDTVVSPLDPLKKLAFLSVVNSGDTEASSKAVKALDSYVLTTIFDFAAETHTRFVHVRYYEDE